MIKRIIKLIRAHFFPMEQYYSSVQEMLEDLDKDFAKEFKKKERKE